MSPSLGALPPPRPWRLATAYSDVVRSTRPMPTVSGTYQGAQSRWGVRTSCVEPPGPRDASEGATPYLPLLRTEAGSGAVALARETDDLSSPWSGWSLDTSVHRVKSGVHSPLIRGAGRPSQPAAIVRHPRRARPPLAVGHEFEPDGRTGSPLLDGHDPEVQSMKRIPLPRVGAPEPFDLHPLGAMSHVAHREGQPPR
jgi:hypothetical protein